MPRRLKDTNAPGAVEPGERLSEVIYEFVPLGSAIKVSAVDPETGTEVAIMGPATAAQHDLERVALAKLRYILNQRAGPARGPDDDPPEGGGVIA